ncbi:RNase H domain-containing protein [Trichonephila clavipes]|nr:RNase H domain-containing protein [Trichonephila clavipes]
MAEWVLVLSRAVEFSSKMGMVLGEWEWEEGMVLICKRNSDYCSIFQAELLAIEEALKFCFTESVNTDIWIFSDNRNSIQHLSEWWRHGDRTTKSIVQLLNSMSTNFKIFFQWVPLHAPAHKWDEGNHSDAALLRTGSSPDETTLASFRCGHTRAQQHVADLKVYPSCPNCNVTQATPVHLFACIGYHKSQLLSSPTTVL